MIKAACQPKLSAIIGTSNGATIAPIFEPELKIPVAKALSLRGNHSEMVLMAAGKLPDSPIPSANLATPNPIGVRAKACDIAAKDHTIIDSMNPFFVPKKSINLPTNSNPMA